MADLNDKGICECCESKARRLHSQGGPTMAKIYEAAEEMLRWIVRAVWLPIERTRSDPYVTVSQTSI